MLIAASGIFVLVMLLCLVVPALVFIVFVATLGAPWLQAFTSGVPISFVEIIGMKFRKTDVKTVLRTLVMAKQAGAPLSRAEVERAYLQGVDLEKVTLAFIQAKKENMGITFKELVDADLEDKLSKKLGR